MAALALGILLLGPAPAYGDYELIMTDGITTVRCANFGAADSAGCVPATPDGLETFVGPLGIFAANVTTGLTKPILLAPSLMDINTVTVTAGGPGTLTITWSDTGWPYDIPPFGFEMAAGGVAGSGTTVTYSAYVDDANVPSAQTALIGTLGSFGPGAYSGTLVAGGPPATNPYSLTQKLTLTFTGPGQVISGDFALNIVPEPASVVFLGTALLGVTALFRKKLQKRS
jgi:hypothetical protein